MLAVVLVLTASSNPALADWTQDGNAISTAFDLQMNPTIISDGGTGAFIAWQDRRGGDFDIYVQRIDALGNVQWAADGIAVCAAGADQSDARLVTDGAGGIIVVWEDARTTTEFDIYAQRIDAAGLPLWEANGVVVSVATLNQHNPSIASDESGGAWVVWQDHRNGQPDIYTHHLNADGVDTLWTDDGNPLCTASRAQQTPLVISDESGGAIACWVDRRAGLGDIYAARFGSTVFWATNGVAMCADPEDQVAPAIATDRINGAFVAWADMRNGNWDIYANHINHLGDSLLAVNGVAICTAAGDQNNPVAVSKGYPAFYAGAVPAGSAIMAWDDKRADAGDIYARDLRTDGGFDWTPDGIAVCTAPLAQVKPTATIDAENGAIVAWQDHRPNYDADVYAQRVSSGGSPQWPDNGVLLCGATGDQYDPVVAVSDDGAAIVAWEDVRSGSYDVYAQYAVGPPNTVAILSFAVDQSAQGVTLRAAFHSDLVVERVNVYRGGPHGALAKIDQLSGGGGKFAYVDRGVEPGATYRYQIGVVDADGEFFSPITTVSVDALSAALEQNRPNPFNPSTTIRFVVPEREHVSLAVYDASGRIVRRLLDETARAGVREVVWDGRDERGVAQSSGVYFYRLSTGKRVESRKMVLLK
jgi:hypothetical protein